MGRRSSRTHGSTRLGNDRHVLRGLQSWSERDALSRMKCPRMSFAGADDVIESEGTTFRVGPLLAEHRVELEETGWWTVRLVDGAPSRSVHASRCRRAARAPLPRSDFDPGIDISAARVAWLVQILLPCVIPLTAILEVEPPQRVGGALSMPLHDWMPAAGNADTEADHQL